jgi:hypothetical protein
VLELGRFCTEPLKNAVEYLFSEASRTGGVSSVAVGFRGVEEGQKRV